MTRLAPDQQPPASLVDEKDTQILSVVVPVYNEHGTLEEVVTRLLALESVCQVVLVDDGSETETAELIDRLGRLERVGALRHTHNRGKGAALRTGFAACEGQIIAVQDADLEYEPESLAQLIKPIFEGTADVVYGSRWLGADSHGTPLMRRLANRFLTLLSNRLTGLYLTDMETGSKVFSRRVIEGIELREERFGIEPEMTARVAKAGWRLVELPIGYSPRSYNEGKKIGLRDGLWAVWCIFRYMR